MRINTGKGWSENIPGARGRVSGIEPKSNRFSVGGAMVDGESPEERTRRLNRAKYQRKAEQS